MKEMKKLFILFTLSLCSLAAWAQTFNSEDGTLSFTITGASEVSVSKGSTAPSGDLTIPSTVTYDDDTYTVTSIGYQAFYSCTDLTSVTIPNSVTSIESYAFSSCNSLLVATIPNSVTSMGAYVFNVCRNLTNVTIPNLLTAIRECTFRDCRNLTSVAIPNSVTLIDKSAFEGCSSLTSVTIPNSVHSIGHYTFRNCSGLSSVTIGNAVNSIGTAAFEGCSSLTSITIPNSVRVIPNNTFNGCSSLTSVTIPNSVLTIANNAFNGCSNLKTVYNLSSRLTITKGSSLNGYVAYWANRVVTPNTSGSGANAIYQIPDTFSFVDAEDDVETHIPRSTIPNIVNLIYNDGGWKAKNIVLTDGQDAFEAPETFTAETATYTREFTNSNRSTLYLPFTAAIPANFEVYDFSNFANNTISFTKREDSIYAYTPYLVGYDLSKDGNTTTCTITKTNAVFPKSESANYHPVTHNDMTFSGVISRTQMTSTNNYGYSNGFFVQSGGSAHVNPFRCYFTYTPSSNAPQSLPPSLNVEFGYGDPVGIDAVETPEQEYDNRYGKDVYDMLGRLVRKNADNLQGLPRGIYIWKGKKHINN